MENRTHNYEAEAEASNNVEDDQFVQEHSLVDVRHDYRFEDYVHYLFGQKVVVSYVKSPDSFYIRCLKDNDVLQYITTELDGSAENLGIIESEIKEDSVVVVSQESTRYRAIILAVHDTTCEVRLIDRGDTLKIKKSDCYELPHNLSKIPKLAVLCCLTGINCTNTNWTAEDLDNIRNMLCGSPRKLKIFQLKNIIDGRNHLEVELSLEDKTNVANVFRSIIYGIDVVVPKARRKRFNNAHIEFILGTEYDVKILHVNNPGSFYVRKYMHDDIYDRIFEQVNSLLEVKKHRIPVYAPYVGMPVAYKHNNKQWCRSEILAIGEGKLCQKKFIILLVDLGQEMRVYWRDLFQLPHTLLSYPKQALHCKLYGVSKVRDNDWPDQSTNVLKSLMDTTIKLISESTYDEVHSVGLLHFDDKMHNTCINLSLIKNCDVESTVDAFGDSVLAIYFSDEANSGNNDEVHSAEKIKVDIVNYVNPSNIFVVYWAENERFQKLRSSMANFYDLNEENLSPVKNYDPKMYYALDMPYGWYRAQFINVISDDEVTMLLIDLDENVTVSKNVVYYLDEEFEKVERRITRKCHLDGIIPIGSDTWSMKVVNRFRDEILQRMEFYVTLKKDVVNGSQPIELWTTCSGSSKGSDLKIKWISFNELIKERGLALPSKPNINIKELSSNYNDGNRFVSKNKTDKSIAVTDWRNPKLLKTKRFKAIVTFVTDDVYFYVQKLTDIPALDEMNDFLQRRYNSSSPDNFSYREKQPCIAKFIDNKWYRARIVEIFAIERAAKVQFIDYGNEETIPLENLRANLSKTDVPIFCYKIGTSKIESIRENGIWTEPMITFIHSATVSQKFVIILKKVAKGCHYQADHILNMNNTIDILDYLVENKIARFRDAVRDGTNNSQIVKVTSPRSDTRSNKSKNLTNVIEQHNVSGQCKIDESTDSEEYFDAI